MNSAGMFGDLALIGLSIWLIKDLSLVKSLPEDKIHWHEFLPDQLDLYKELSGKVTAGMLQQFFNIVLDVESQIKRSTQAKICVEMGLIKMCSVDSLVGVAEIISVLREAGQKKKIRFKPGSAIDTLTSTVNEPLGLLASGSKPPHINTSPARSPKKSSIREKPSQAATKPSSSNVIRRQTVLPASDFVATRHPTPDRSEAGPAVPDLPAPKRSEIDQTAPEQATSDLPSSKHLEPDPQSSPPVKKSGYINRSQKEEISLKWEGFVEEVARNSNQSLVSLLRNSVVQKLTDRELVIGYKNIQIFDDKKKSTIEKSARNFFNPTIKVQYWEKAEGIDESLKVKADIAQAKQLEERKAVASKDPKVLEILEIFPESKITNVRVIKEM